MLLKPHQRAVVMAMSLFAPRRLARLFLAPRVQPMVDALVTSGRTERVEFMSDGVCCRGWWVRPAKGGTEQQAIILAHGWTSHLMRMSALLDPLLQMGYQVLLYNARSHGDSDPGPHISLAQFTADLTAAIRFAKGRVARVAVVGHSMGAAAAVLTAAEGEPVETVVALAPLADPLLESASMLDGMGVDGERVMRRIARSVEQMIGRSFESISPERRLAEVKCPLLVLHGTADEVVPVVHFHRLKAVGGANVETLLVEGANHDGIKTAPPTWPRIEKFLQRTFPPEAV